MLHRWHAWTFHDAFFSNDLSVKAVMAAGAFDGDGVGTCHTDLMDGGLEFEVLSKRSQSIHASHFSPQNVQVRLKETSEVASFVSAAFHRPVVTDPPEEVVAAEAAARRDAAGEASSSSGSDSEDSVPPVFYETKGVITLHVVAVSEVAESRLRHACTRASNLRQLEARVRRLGDKCVGMILLVAPVAREGRAMQSPRAV